MNNDTPIAAGAELNAHERHCFVVMPFGADTDEQRWFRGWYEAVIQPAVIACKFEPILSASEDQPAAINDEIRSHLVFDPMVVVDLGGRSPSDPPNPNVMYELGIRHAFGLPLVILGWEGQQLPFDVSNQRAILSKRDFLDIEGTRQRLSRFIAAAQEGRFYNPMEAVGREAAIDTTSLVLGEESLLVALANEVRELRSTISRRQLDAPRVRRSSKIKQWLGKEKQTELWAIARSLGLDSRSWAKFLSSPVPQEMQQEMQGYDLPEWAAFLSLKVPELKLENLEYIRTISGPGLPSTKLPSEEFIGIVKSKLPEQPWPKKIHVAVADELGVSTKQVQRAIRELIRRGDFSHQVDGVVMPPSDGKIIEAGNMHDVTKPQIANDSVGKT